MESKNIDYSKIAAFVKEMTFTPKAIDNITEIAVKSPKVVQRPMAYTPNLQTDSLIALDSEINQPVMDTREYDLVLNLPTGSTSSTSKDSADEDQKRKKTIIIGLGILALIFIFLIFLSRNSNKKLK
jgi:hypothetical protein